MRLTSNRAVSGLAPQSESKTTDVRIRLRETAPFSPSLEQSDGYFYSSPVCGGLERPNLCIKVDPSLEYFAFFYRDGARFTVRRDGSEVWADWPEDYAIEDACTYLLGPIMGFVLRLRGITCLHASAISLGDCAIALAGSPGVGKSTLAAAFARNGFPVLSDDVVALADQGRQFLAQPGYPRVNLWPDSVHAVFGSDDALPRITPTWDKRYLGLAQNGCSFAAEPLPLRAVYILGTREPTLALPVIKEVAGSEAFMALVANTYMNYLLDREMRRQEFDLLGRVAASVPIKYVRSGANASGLAGLREAIVADATRSIAAEQPILTAHCN